MAAVLASILETDIPEFGMNVSDEEYDNNMRRWLENKGYSYSETSSAGKPPRDYHIIIGTSPRGGLHAVVGKNGKIVHDPHPQDGTGRGLASVDTFGILKPTGGDYMQYQEEVPQEYRELMLPQEYRTGICPACGEDAQINMDGTVDKHGKCSGWGLPALVSASSVKDSGEKFKKLEHKLAHKKGIYDPKGLAAAIGRKAMGKAAFQKKAAAGRKG